MGKQIIKVGDTVECTPLHMREKARKVQRIVTYVGPMGIGVNMFGYRPFYMKRTLDKVKRIKKGPAWKQSKTKSNAQD